jgi:hypothetical protein
VRAASAPAARDGLCAAALLILVAHLALQPVAETDLFFRLAAGTEVLRRGRPFHENLFSFTFPQQPYLDSAWLFDVGAALLHRAGGFAALVVAKTAVLLAVFLGAWHVARRRGAHALIALGVLGAAAFLVAPRMVERPHLFSFAGEIALLAILQAAAARPRRLFLAPVLVAAWANLHAGAFVAPLILGAATAGTIVDRWRARRDDDSAPAGASPAQLGAAALASAGALLLTPVGIGIFRYLAFHVGIEQLHPVDEFRAPDLTSDAPLVAGGIVTAAGLLLFSARAPHRWRDLLPVMLVGLLAARQVRFGADAILLAVPLLAARLTQLAATCPPLPGLARLRVHQPSPRRWVQPVVIMISFAALTALLAVLQPPRARVGLAAALFPEAAIRFVEDNDLGDRMYNDFDIGGYLAWRWYPRRRVFVDPRLPAYPRAFHALLGRADLTRAAWEEGLAPFAIDSALVADAGINPRVAWWDPERWALVWRGEDARVFVRRLPRWRALIAVHEIPASFSFDATTGAAIIPLDHPPAASPVARCEWDLRLGDLLHEIDGGDDGLALPAYLRALSAPPGCLLVPRRNAAAAWAGALLLARHRWADALATLDREIMTDAGPDRDNLLANRALALEGLGRRVDAADAWQRPADQATGPLARRAEQRARTLRAGGDSAAQRR